MMWFDQKKKLPHNKKSKFKKKKKKDRVVGALRSLLTDAVKSTPPRKAPFLFKLSSCQ